MTDPVGADSKPFHVEEATIEELHEAIRAGRTNCVDVVKQYIARVRAYNGVASLLVTEDGAPVPEAIGAVRGGAPLAFPDRDGRRRDDLSRSRQVSGAAAGIRPHGADRLRPERRTAIRHDRRQARQHAAQRAGDAEHPRRALGHVQGRIRPTPLARPPAARCAADLRDVPPLPGRARTRRRARRAIRHEPRSGRNADVRRRLLVQGPVRYEGHAHDRRRRCGL